MKTQLFHWSLGLYLLVGIFYVLPPGGPQPADFFMAMIILTALSSGRIKIEPPDASFLLFICYSFLVAGVWSTILLDLSLYLGALYFSYNFLVYLIFQQHQIGAEKTAHSLLPFVLGALFTEVVLLFSFDSGTVREVGTFTNPNQLSYFGLCFTSMGLMISKYEQNVIAGVITLLMGWIISLLGLSKAAMVAMAFQTIIFGILLPSRRGLFFLLTTILAGFMLIFMGQEIAAALSRIDNLGVDHDDTLAGRGYDRIVNDVEHLFFGAGEGQYRRHDSIWRGEIHSSAGTILFSYGIPGTVLFLVFFTSIWRRNRIGFFTYIAPLLLYSLTHNGLRYTPFWICLALCSSLESSSGSGVKKKC